MEYSTNYDDCFAMQPIADTDSALDSKAPLSEGDGQEYEVETLLAKRIVKGRHVQYLVKWKDYSEQFNSWEPLRNLAGCKRLIREFKRRHLLENVHIIHELPRSKTFTSNALLQIENHLLSSSSILKENLPQSINHHKEQTLNITSGPIAALKNAQLSLRLPTSELPGNEPFSMEALGELIQDDFSAKLARFQETLDQLSEGRIRIINTIDYAAPPSDFTYITRLIYRKDVLPPDSAFLVGCECMGECGKSTACLCMAQNFDGLAAYKEDRVQLPYGPIYECNSRCLCGIGCSNRVIQQGGKVPLDIMRFGDGRGWGVVAARFIPRGTYIDQYIGEIITTKEADRRFRDLYTEEERSYLFDLDFDSTWSSEYTIDAYRYGNVSHFFNHSCGPNMKVYAAFTENLDPHKHMIAFFTCRDVQIGEELTFDYLGLSTRERIANDDGKHGQPRKADRRVAVRRKSKNSRLSCLCGSKNCRKFVYL